MECLDSAIMDTDECQPLFIDVQDFYEGLNMKVTQPIPLLLVDRQALNEALDGEKHVRFVQQSKIFACLFDFPFL